MQPSHSLPILFALLLLAACGHVSKTGDSTNTSAANNEPSGFSATVDGVKLSGSGVDEMQLQNTAFVYAGKAAGDHLRFILFTTKNSSDLTPNESFSFYVPNKTGAWNHKEGKDDCQCSIQFNEHLQNGNFSRFNDDSVTVHIISITKTRVTGTFSGTFRLSGDTPRGDKKQITVTDGNFDIPFSTGNIRPV